MLAGAASYSTGTATFPSMPCSTEPARLMTSDDAAIGRGALNSFGSGDLTPFLR